MSEAVPAYVQESHDGMVVVMRGEEPGTVQLIKIKWEHATVAVLPVNLLVEAARAEEAGLKVVAEAAGEIVEATQ